MNILFIGIFDNNEPNTALRNAFQKVSKIYVEVAWNSIPKNILHETIALALNNLNRRPDLIFLQLQAPDIIKSVTLEMMKQTGAFICQWTGDARQPLPRHYIDFGRQIDLSLFSNQNDVDTMRSNGVKADFLQVAADHTIYTPIGPKIITPNIVFMGNNYNNTFPLSKYRFKMVEFLRNHYRSDFGMYGCNWPKEWKIKSLMYNHQEEAKIYRSCKIAINLAHYDLKKYASDRLFRIMSSGAFCISKVYPEMQEFGNGKNMVTFNGELSDLKAKIDYYLRAHDLRMAIAKNGCEATHNNWTWDHRIQELLQIIQKWKIHLKN